MAKKRKKRKKKKEEKKGKSCSHLVSQVPLLLLPRSRGKQ